MDTDIKDKLLSKDSKIRKMEIEQTATSGSADNSVKGFKSLRAQAFILQ
ncbi:MAG: hypothetical protein V4506_01460 [Bacteroidota bacterium]